MLTSSTLHTGQLHDYISPGYCTLVLDEAFPFKTIGNPQANPWPYLRRDLPHHWYVDSRYPTIGFLSRDEAHILYNNACLFKGQHALEIGCWMGWSAAHIAAAGVGRLDVIDPVLAQPDFMASLTQAMSSLNAQATTHLWPQPSPLAVETLGQQGQLWSFIFIDGDHNRPAPRLDAEAVCRFAHPNAMVLFHDLTSPHVSEGLDYFKAQGWQTAIYNTMQIMGVAWRGTVQPVGHTPDPTIAWVLPDHLQHFAVIGEIEADRP
jgi:predicted O-methyltransferase YrrM